MPNLWLEKTDTFSARRYCSHADCEENPKYFLKNRKKGWRKKIKSGIIIGIIQIGNGTEVYCPDCIDKIFLEFKKVFDKKLWIFH